MSLQKRKTKKPKQKTTDNKQTKITHHETHRKQKQHAEMQKRARLEGKKDPFSNSSSSYGNEDDDNEKQVDDENDEDENNEDEKQADEDMEISSRSASLLELSQKAKPNKRRYRNYSEKDLRDAMEAVQNGECRMNAAVERFGIPPSTLAGYANGKVTPGCRSGTKPSLSREEELEIVSWVNDQKTKPYWGKAQQSKVFVNIQKKKGKQFTSGWWYRLLSRNKKLLKWQYSRNTKTPKA